MSRFLLPSFVILGALLASCGGANKLDRYPLHGTNAVFAVSIEPIRVSEPEDYGSFGMNLLVGVVSAILTTRPDPLMHDNSLAAYVQDGFETELDSVLEIGSSDTIGPTDVKMAVHISDCTLVSTDSSCSVKFSEDLTISIVRSKQEIFFGNSSLIVPLNYCGSAEDSVSTPAYGMSEERYKQLSKSEQLSALQCAAYDAGSVLADSLAHISERAAAKH